MGIEPATQPSADQAQTVAEPAGSRRGERPSASPAGARTPTERSSGRISDVPSAGSSGSHVTSVVTPRETLHVQEIRRTRVFALACIAFAAFVLGTLGVIGGDPVAKRVFVAALFAIAASCAWLAWALRRDEGYTVERATAVAYVCILGAFTGIWFFGVFSPAPMILPFGLSFFSVGQSSRAVLSVYLTCALLQLALMLGVALGGLPDPGLIRAHALAPVEQAAVIALVQATLFLTYLVQRKTREATIYAIEQHDQVVRSLAQRDALLLEARQDLAQAMRAGSGRWSDEVVGSFRLGRVLGRGAMGEVYEAAHVTTGEPAAVKLLHAHVLAQADLVQRFVREARIVASLQSSNVVRVLEVSPPDAPVPYLAMERLVGQDLADYLREHKRMGVRGVLAMLRQVGAGLDAAWAAGVVHRDLKPRNLFLATQGTQQTWKILDFGVARLAGEETLTLDQIVGTPNYMSPEQASGGAVTPQSDLFALGVITYRALTGRPAFEGEMTPEILYKVVHAMPPCPTSIAPLPTEFDAVLALAMAKDPGDRFESAAGFAAALESAARGRLDASLRARAARLIGRLPWSDV